jgi:predicted phosphodiesterase
MIAIISDVHGNLAALRACLERIDGVGVEEIISLGDVAGYYPQLNECSELLRERAVPNVLGNHDFYLISGESCGRSTTADEMVRWQREHVRADNLAWLAASLPGIERTGISMVHGGWRDPVDEYMYRISDAYFAERPQRWFFSGHTHVQGVVQLPSGKVYCNPGSVGQPRDGDPRAAFALFDGETIQLERVLYDVEATVAATLAAGFPLRSAENLRSGTRIGGRVDALRTS